MSEVHMNTAIGLAAGFTAAIVLAGCAAPVASLQSSETLATAAPQYRVGDRWVYRVRDGFANPKIYEETHAVSAIGADGITVDVTVTGGGETVRRVEKWVDGGRMSQGALMDIETRRFAEPLLVYRFPLQPGSTWNQRVANFNTMTGREGPISRYVRVGGQERVTTPAGTFDAVRLNVVMRLDDEEFWRWPTDATYTVWYAPAAKASIREVRRADYLEKGGDQSVGRLPTQNAVVELVSFTPGA
jgi:hypothetical protein